MSESPGRSVVAVIGATTDLVAERAELEPLGVDFRVSAAAAGDSLAEAARGATVILAGSKPRFDSSVLSELSCRGIVRYGVGVDNIDLEAAASRGIWVANVPRYGEDAVAVHALALVLAAVRGVVGADRQVRDGQWSAKASGVLHLPQAMTAGVVGVGRIGSRVATLLNAVDFDVAVHDPYADFATHPARTHHVCDSLSDLLGRSDVVTLHVPGTAEDGPLIDATAIAHMRPGSVLVNTARGSLIDEAALLSGLAAGRPALAALDVLATEPIDADRYAAVRDQMIITPHMAWYTEESERQLRAEAAMEAARILRGERPRNAVAVPR